MLFKSYSTKTKHIWRQNTGTDWEYRPTGWLKSCVLVFIIKFNNLLLTMINRYTKLFLHHTVRYKRLLERMLIIHSFLLAMVHLLTSSHMSRFKHFDFDNLCTLLRRRKLQSLLCVTIYWHRWLHPILLATTTGPSLKNSNKLKKYVLCVTNHPEKVWKSQYHWIYPIKNNLFHDHLWYTKFHSSAPRIFVQKSSVALALVQNK